MTLRDEITKTFMQRTSITESNGEMADRIIYNVIKPRFDEIINALSAAIYYPSDEMGKWYNEEMLPRHIEIRSLCTLTEPEPDKPTPAVGQTWEKNPSATIKILGFFTNSKGNRYLAFESVCKPFSHDGSCGFMSEENFEGYRLIKESE